MNTPFAAAIEAMPPVVAEQLITAWAGPFDHNHYQFAWNSARLLANAARADWPDATQELELLERIAIQRYDDQRAAA
ncbi:hypothetical protein [Endothiovibrio diazotrophicus]